MQDQYTKNYKTLMKNIKEDTHQWKDSPYLWIRINNTVKMSILQKTIFRFSLSAYQNASAPFIEIEKTILNFAWSHKRPQVKQPCVWRAKLKHHTLWFQTIIQGYISEQMRKPGFEPTLTPVSRLLPIKTDCLLY